MKNQVYVELFEEGTPTWRPVPASKIADNIYLLDGYNLYDPEDEHWEFLPGSRVLVEQTKSKQLKAVKLLDGTACIGDHSIYESEFLSFQKSGTELVVEVMTPQWKRVVGPTFREKLPGPLLKILFSNVTSFAAYDPEGRTLYGLFEMVKPGQERHFYFTTEPDRVHCLEITASTLLIQK